MLIRNVEFDFKPTRGADYKRYAHGRKAALVAIDALQKDDEDYVTKMCEIMDDFFAGLLGEDYADLLDIDTDDIEPLLLLLDEVNHAAQPSPAIQSIAASIPELPATADVPVTSSLAVAPPNRAQRRAARRAAKRHA